MEKDNKILLGAVLILLVAMISFNFNDAVTGDVASGAKIAVTVNPAQVYFSYNDLNNKPSKTVIVTVTVQNGQIENNVDLYRSTGERTTRTKEICKPATSSYCTKGVYEVPFTVTSDLDVGDYYFRVSKRPVAKENRQTVNSNTITITKYKPANTYEY